MSDDEHAEEPLDPRIQHELEKLNKASLLINKLENDLGASRSKFRQLLSESTGKLGNEAKRLGSCIDRAKPYYDCRYRATEVQLQAQKAAARYERAIAMQNAAREMVDLAEQGYETKKKKQSFDTAWQEMLNHATIKVMDAENERVISEGEHQRTAALYAKVQEEVNEQYKENKRSIAKSKSYFEMKAKLNTDLEKQKAITDKLQQDVDAAKKLYAKALSNLECISMEIHEKRNSNSSCKSGRDPLGVRQPGVGSETKSMPNGIRAERENEIIISFPPNLDKPEQPSFASAGILDSRLSSLKNCELSKEHIKPVDPTVSKKPKNQPPPHAPVSIQISAPDQTTPNKLELNSRQSPDTTDTTTNTDAHDEEKDTITSPLVYDGEVNKKPVCRSKSDLSIRSAPSDGSAMSPSIIRKHRRVLSGSLQLSAKRLLEDSAASDSDSNSINSFIVLDDEGVVNAMSNHYFDSPYEDKDTVMSSNEDYSTLPEALSIYQRSFEETRKSINFDDVDLKLDQVLKLISEVDDESIV